VSTPRGAVLTLRWLGGTAVAIAVLVASTGLATSLARTYERTTTVADPGLAVLEVDIDAGTVDVIRGGDEVEIVREVAGSWRPPEAASDRVGDRLRLTGSCRPSFLQTECYTNYTVTVPDDVELVLSSSTGEILVDGGTGDVTATTSAGRIDLTGMEADVVRASSSVGEVALAFAEPPTSVDASTSTGRVEVVVPDDATRYAVDATSSVGDASVAVPRDPESPRRITARTSVGEVVVRTAE